MANRQRHIHSGGLDDFPFTVRHFEVRRDQNGVRVSRGYLYPKLFGATEKPSPSADGTDVFMKSPHRVPYAQFLTGLQCAPNEPDLNSASGSLHILRMAPPSRETLEMVCAYAETRCQNRTICQSTVDRFKSGGFPDAFGMYQFSGFQEMSLFRVKDNELYFDWPWGRGRLRECQNKRNNGTHMLKADATWFNNLNNRLLLNTLKVLQVNDSVFLMGGEESWLPWLTPFPAFASAPQMTSAEMPWPWTEFYMSATSLYDNAVSNGGEKSRRSHPSRHSFVPSFVPHPNSPILVPDAHFSLLSIQATFRMIFSP